jgi:hypothetical protein
LRVQIGPGPKSSRSDKIRIHNTVTDLLSSLAVPDSGSGIGKKSRSGSGIRILDEHPGLYFNYLGVKILKFFLILTWDPGSGNGKIRIQEKHLGSATLLLSTYRYQ